MVRQLIPVFNDRMTKGVHVMVGVDDGYRYVPRNHHPQNNLRVSYPGYVVSTIFDYSMPP